MLKLTLIILTVFIIPSFSYLDVYIPQCAHKIIDKPINHTLSNFGYIPYGQTYIGEVFKPSSQNNGQLCTIQNEPQLKASGSKIFMLVRRRNCKFTPKVLNAQKLGAHFVIVYDHQHSQYPHLVMKNDGHGHLVTIPSIFISGADGQQILLVLKECKQNLILRQKFQVFETDIATLSYWLSLNNRQSYILLRDLYQNEYYDVIENYVNSSVRFKVYYGCQDLYCDDKDCIGSSENQYCLPIKRKQNQQQNENIVSGGQLLKQSLRMYLLFEMLPQYKNYIWYEYMDNFDKNLCLQEKDVETCSYDTMKQSGITNQLIAAINNTVEQTLQEINSQKFSEKNIFYKVQKQGDQKNILFYPQAVINGKNFYGLFKAQEIFEMICSSLTSQPDQCYYFKKNKQRNTMVDKSDDLWLTVILIVVLMTLGFIVALVVYSKLIKREVNQQMSVEVNRMVQNYVNLAQKKFSISQDNGGSFNKVNGMQKQRQNNDRILY